MRTIEANLSATTVERFWCKVDKDGPIPERRPDLGPCWIWIAAKGPRGDGAFWLPELQFVAIAHRVAYVLAHGPIPEGLEVDHLCFVPSCVNPGHLEAVTGEENTRRWRVVAVYPPLPACCGKGHEYTPENTRYDPKGSRHCRRCDLLARDRRSEARRQRRIERLGFDPGPRSRSYVDRDDQGRIARARAAT